MEITKNLIGWHLERIAEESKSGIVAGKYSDGTGTFGSEPLKSVRLEDGTLVMTDGVSEIRCDPNEVRPDGFRENVFRDIFPDVDPTELDRIVNGIRDTIAKVIDDFWKEARAEDLSETATPTEKIEIRHWNLEKYPEDGKTGIVYGLCDEYVWGFTSEPLKSVRLDDGILVMTDGITEISCDPKSVYPPEYSEKAFRDIFSGMDGAELDRILDSIRDTIAEADKKYWANTKFRTPLKLQKG